MAISLFRQFFGGAATLQVPSDSSAYYRPKFLLEHVTNAWKSLALSKF